MLIATEIDDVNGSITTMVISSEAKMLASQSYNFLFNGSNLLSVGMIISTRCPVPLSIIMLILCDILAAPNMPRLKGSHMHGDD